MNTKILNKYKEALHTFRMTANKQVEEYLIQSSEAEQNTQNESQGNKSKEETLSMVFPGTNIYHFNNRLNDMDLQPICIAFMPQINFLIELDLSYNKLSDKGGITISKLVEFAENIKKINLSGNQIADVGAEKLSVSLKGKMFLHHLNLNSNHIGNTGIMFINELLFTNSGLLNLDIGNNHYDWDAMIAITSALTTTNRSLNILNVDDSNYKIQDQDFFTHFGKMLLKNKSLKKLSMKLHKLRFEGVGILTDHLVFNKSLEVLDISCNQICFQGMTYISDYLQRDDTVLKSLNLANNKISDQGAKLFAQGIALNKSLIHVDLTTNSINCEGLCRLAEGLSENETLMSLKLFWNNSFGKESIMMFKNLLSLKGKYFYPDFHIYEDMTGETMIAYLETHVPNENNLII